MKNLKLFTVLFAGVALVVLGCSKGTTGPAGPKGPAGPDSVVHSNWIILAMTRNVTSANDTFYTQTINAPALTQRILDSGIILTYLSDLGNPPTVVNATTYFSSELFSAGSIDLTSFIDGDFSGFGYRYVLVPGSIVTGNVVSGPAKGLTKKQLMTMSYESVEKLIGESPGSVIVQ
jgi:hypothetical protein